MRNHGKWFVGTALLWPMLLSGTMASAQELPPAPRPAGGLTEIVVTAQKRAENLSDVPMSITAMTSDTLNQQNIQDLTAIGTIEPGVQIANNSQRIEVTIRGIGASSVVAAYEQPVAVHVDGFYQARASGVGNNFFDVERVEVLKGPQGTLYGRNATGGAINIVMKKPTDEFSVEARAEGIMIDDNDSSGGNGWGWILGGVINVPLSDTIQTRFSAITTQRDGYKTIINQHDEEFEGQDADNFALRGQINFRLTDRLNWLVAADYYRANDRSGYFEVLGGARPDVPLFGETIGGRNCGYCRITYTDRIPSTKMTNWGVTSTIDYEIDDNFSVKSLTQYQRSKYAMDGDFDGVDINLGNMDVRHDSKQITQELQVAGTFDRLRFIVGGYYFRERITNNSDAPFPIFDRPEFAPFPGVEQGVRLSGSIKTDAYAAFGELTYDVTDRLAAIVGARYSHEVKGGANNVVNRMPGLGLTTSFVGPVPDIKFNAFTPKFGLNYKLDDDTLLYASYTKGFKSGGYVIGNEPSNSDGILADRFNPEKVEAYEVGLKASALDRRLQLNLAGFYYKYRDLQLNVIIDNSTVIQNSGKAKIYGIEGDLVAMPTDALRLHLSGTLMRPRFVESGLLLGNTLYPEHGAQSLAGKYLPRASELSATLGADYTFELGNYATIVPSFTAAYKSKQYFTAFNDPGVMQPGHWLLKAAITYNSPDDRYSLTLYGDNLTNEYVVTGMFPGSVAWGYQNQAITAPGRVFGIRANAKF